MAPETITEEIERRIGEGTYFILALWAVRILDRYGDAPIAKGKCGESWTTERYHQGKEEWKVFVSGNGGQIFYGRTPGEARIRAARALVAQDPSLDDATD